MSGYLGGAVAAHVRVGGEAFPVVFPVMVWILTLVRFRWVASFLRLLEEHRSPEARFWLQLTLGAVALLAAGWIFAEIAENVVTRDLITVVDQWLAEWLHRHTDNPLVTVPGYSFPSGHTMLATLLYGFPAVLLFRPVRRWRWRTVAAGGAALVIPLVAISRMYLGAHYLSDTLAAIAAGVFWLALCLTSVATLRWQRRPADEDVSR